jgi:hypothetical protein
MPRLIEADPLKSFVNQGVQTALHKNPRLHKNPTAKSGLHKNSRWTRLVARMAA